VQFYGFPHRTGAEIRINQAAHWSGPRTEASVASDFSSSDKHNRPIYEATATKDFTTVRYQQLRWRRQKNLVNGEITPYKVEDDAIPALCPVRAALRIYQLVAASTDKR